MQYFMGGSDRERWSRSIFSGSHPALAAQNMGHGTTVEHQRISNLARTTGADASSNPVLDLAVLIARNFYLLLFLPLLAGIAAYFSSAYLPHTYESKSYVAITIAESKVMDALLRTPLVLDRLAEKYKVQGRSPELRRDALDARIRISTSKGADARTGGLYTLTTIAETPAAAKSLNKDLLDAWLELTKPGPIERASIKQQLAWAQENVTIQTDLIGRLSKESTQLVDQGALNGLVTSIDNLREKQEKTHQLAERLTQRLQGSFQDRIVSEPTLQVEPISPKRAIVTLSAAIATGLLMLAVLLLRYFWGAGMTNPATSAKLQEIRRALIPFGKSGGQG